MLFWESKLIHKLRGKSKFKRWLMFDSVRSGFVLHWHGQLGSEPAFPRDGDGPAWPIAWRPFPVVQALFRLENCASYLQANGKSRIWILPQPLGVSRLEIFFGSKQL